MQTPPATPGRLGKEGAVKSEMQITLDWVSPSQTSPRRLDGCIPSLVWSRSSLVILGNASPAQRKGLVVVSALTPQSVWCTQSVCNVSAAESKAWNTSTHPGIWNTPVQSEIDDIRH
ncbi:hypothetical protein N8I77_008051 [Diaporthe amygdali]|uniref:Uncharacterized protein n=1 Tax=Phomopsis amygdali TaxID=1214568 RepID=A0AAD9W267_PHOAM|nr:hypothetical protein N8I77_008051 [Diaporthe amygdali]